MSMHLQTSIYFLCVNHFGFYRRTYSSMDPRRVESTYHRSSHKKSFGSIEKCFYAASSFYL